MRARDGEPRVALDLGASAREVAERGRRERLRRPADEDIYSYGDDYQAFFVVEPGIELEVNVIKLVRFGVGASYRYTTDLDLPGTGKGALRGLNAGFTVKVGRF